MTATEVLRNKDSFTTVVMAVLYDKYGTEFMEWDPSTINLQLYKDFKFFPDNHLRDKIQAGSSLITTNMFYTSFNVFSVICNILSLNGYATDMFIPPEADEVAWGCLEAKLLDANFNPDAFSQDIKQYTGFILEREGIYTPPSILSFAFYGNNPTDNMGEDPEFNKLVMDRQIETKEEFSSALRNKVIELFTQLRSIEDITMNQEFINRSLSRITD